MNPGIDIAARTAWAEARGEGIAGMQAVLNVIAHRAARPGWWGRDIASVCQAPYQFSCWLPGDPNGPEARAVTDDNPLFRSALSMAGRAVDGTLPDLTRGSDSYYATTSPRPLWAAGRAPQIVIGRHAFYRIGLAGDGR